MFLLFACFNLYGPTYNVFPQLFNMNVAIHLSLYCVLYLTDPLQALKMNVMTMLFYAALKDKQKNKHNPTTKNLEPRELSRLQGASLILPGNIKGTFFSN